MKKYLYIMITLIILLIALFLYQPSAEYNTNIYGVPDGLYSCFLLMLLFVEAIWRLFKVMT